MDVDAELHCAWRSLQSIREEYVTGFPRLLLSTLPHDQGSTMFSPQDSSASITVSSQEAQVPGVTDRVVRITGTQSQLMRALALILSKLLESPHYARLCNVPVLILFCYDAPALPCYTAASVSYITNRDMLSSDIEML